MSKTAQSVLAQALLLPLKDRVWVSQQLEESIDVEMPDSAPAFSTDKEYEDYKHAHLMGVRRTWKRTRMTSWNGRPFAKSYGRGSDCQNLKLNQRALARIEVIDIGDSYALIRQELAQRFVRAYERFLHDIGFWPEMYAKVRRCP